MEGYTSDDIGYLLLFAFIGVISTSVFIAIMFSKIIEKLISIYEEMLRKRGGNHG